MKRFNIAVLCFVMAAIVNLTVSNAAHAQLFRSQYTQTKYPIVLVHGFSGFD